MDQRIFSMTEGDGSQSKSGSKGERDAEPRKTAQKESLDSRSRLRCDGSLIIGLVVENSGEVAGKVHRLVHAPFHDRFRPTRQC